MNDREGKLEYDIMIRAFRVINGGKGECGGIGVHALSR